MAIAYTGHGVAASSSVAGTTTGAKAVTAVAGDTIIVCVALAIGVAPSVTDSAGNTYAQLNVQTNTDTCWLFGARNIPGSVTSVTVSWTNSSKWSVCVDTWSGVVGFDTTAFPAIGTSTVPSVTVTNIAATSWLVGGLMSVNTTATWSASGGSQLRRSVPGASTSTPGAALADITQQLGSTTVAATLSLSKPWAALPVELQSVLPATGKPTIVLQAVPRSTTF